MVDSFCWIAATAEERKAFAGGVEGVLAMPFTLAGPRNRLREARVVAIGDERYFLKVFWRTQLKNRLRFRLTSPRCASDAQREAAVTLALRAAGIEAPRPLGVGRRGPTSVYLCARLPGRSLRDEVADRGVSAELRAAVAEFCGGVLGRGFQLPDLSADHVFVQSGESAHRLGLLDLHNGGLVPPGPPPRALLLRVLRRFHRSVQGLPVTRRAGLRFAAELLRSTGRRRWVRSILRSLPIVDTATRYQAPGKAAAYARRNPVREGREHALIARVWPGQRGDTVLDAPCGTGRLLPLLRDELGARPCWADAAPAMLREARSLQGSEHVRAVGGDALGLPFADGCFAGVVMFRFLHHLPPARAARAVAEACRVARRFVVVSFFHPCSAHHLQRRLRQLLAQRTATRFAITHRRLRRWFHQHGFAPYATAAEAAFRRDLWVASFVRQANQ